MNMPTYYQGYANNNYGYNNPYQNNFNQQQYQPQQQLPSAQVQTQIPSQQGLLGKMVESKEVANVTEIPIGSVAFFPTGDLSKIFCKSWLPNGTTQLVEYEPVVAVEDKKEDIVSSIDTSEINEMLFSIQGAIDDLTQKVDKIKLPTTPMARSKKKEVDA